MSLGSKIREIRIKRGFTQEHMSNKLNMGRSNFGHIENNRVIPSSEDIQKISDILNISTDYFYGYSDKDEPIIRAIQRAAKNMSPEDKERMLQMMKLAFNKAFEEEEND